MQSMCIRQVKEYVINKTHRTLINMIVELVKVGTISNKAFLLLVVDAINSYEKCSQITNREEHITNTDNAIIRSTDNVYIISEKSVEAYYFVSKQQFSMEYKVSYAYEYDSVAIRIYLLNMMLNGQSVSRQEIYKPNVKKFVDPFLQGIIKEHCTGLLSLTNNIQNYENLTCQLTDDSIYDGALFDTLPDLNLKLFLCDKPQDKINNSEIRKTTNQPVAEQSGEFQDFYKKHKIGVWIGVVAIIILVSTCI